jgi:hypothetical protein
MYNHLTFIKVCIPCGFYLLFVCKYNTFPELSIFFVCYKCVPFYERAPSASNVVKIKKISPSVSIIISEA